MSILNFDQFGKARRAMDKVIADALADGTASPAVPFASLVQWAALYSDNKRLEAGERSAISTMGNSKPSLEQLGAQQGFEA